MSYLSIVARKAANARLVKIHACTRLKELSQCFQESLRWHVKNAFALEAMLLLCLPLVVLHNSVGSSVRLADNKIAESAIMASFWPCGSGPDAYHEPDADLWKGRQHMRCSSRSGRYAIDSRWE